MRSLPMLLLLAAAATAASEAPRVEQTEIFTDEQARIAIAASGTVAYQQRLLTAAGWGAGTQGEVEVRDGRVTIAPLGEGINIVTFTGAGEARFLAMAPPPPCDRAALLAALPRTGAKLLAGEPYVLLAMGDSVTNTGDYAGMLARLLGRMTGNAHVSMTNRSYPGRSADATARNFAGDIAAAGHPDLGLMMYGLNDQVCFVPLEAVLEHYRFVADGLAARGADTMFLQPTPHIDVPADPALRTPKSEPPWFAFRTIGFAEALRPLADELHVPLAATFAAVWGRGGDGIEASVRSMWPVYPLSYSRQFTSMIESDGKGDTIHPNALGHLAIAKACLTALGAPPEPPALSCTGVSRWDGDGVASTITVTNRGAAVASGRLEVYPELQAELAVERPLPYRLAPGESLSIPVRWTQARTPEDLLRFPLERYLAPGRPLIPLLTVDAAGSRVQAVSAPFAVAATWLHGRSVCEHPVADAGLHTAAGTQRISVPFPATAVGRVPLVRKVEAGGGTGWAVAELAYVRYAGAVRGDCMPDGDLGEWRDQVWSPLGEPCQARFSTGPSDHRGDPAECRMTWSVRAGADAIGVAMRVQGAISADRFTIFLDPRPASELGTVGRYYWFSGEMKPDGMLALSGGETSPRGVKVLGRWRSAGDATDIEMSIPYALCEQTGWPASGDLGWSLWWSHRGSDGATTQLQWSEDGHPWNPRWYGVVRRQETAAPEALPWMVRIR